MLYRRSYRTFLTMKIGKLVKVTGYAVYLVTEWCVKPPVVLPLSVLCKNSKFGITQDLPNSCKYVNNSEVYGSCKYDVSNFFDVRSVKIKENKVNAKTTFVK